MSIRRTLLCALLGLAMAAIARSAAPPTMEPEIMALLRDVGASGCKFYRNGTWYDARRARAHLELKYQAQRLRFTSTEDFILRAATRSSLTGEPYQIRCPGRAVAPIDQWLRDRLARNRASGLAAIYRRRLSAQSSFWTTRVLVTETTPSVSRAMDIALSTASLL